MCTHLCEIAADAFEDHKFIVSELRPKLQHDFSSEVVQVQFRNDSAGEQKHTTHSTGRHGGPLLIINYSTLLISCTLWRGGFFLVCSGADAIVLKESALTGLTASLSFKKEVSPIDSRIWG